ncbi:MAG: GGDEF domain-containing protein, partial [Methylococcaceae bacterium]|nr:GGDEF domain-containing protein [Methylococcaceae bacterium]
LINRDRTNAIGFAENLLKKIEASLPEGIIVTGSIGLATVTKGMIVDFKTLFKAADEAMYKAKSGGRNRVESALVGPLAAESGTN